MEDFGKRFLVVGFSRGAATEVSGMVAESIKISIVDDDESMRKAIKTLVELVGIRVESFSSAEEFLSSNSLQDSACLILDVRMPGISGLELQERLARVNHSVPIIFITAHYSEEERARAIEAGAIEYLQKPFSEKALLTAISSALAIESSSACDTPDQDR
jgi:two-component system, LuxR family, response regulator FixJ